MVHGLAGDLLRLGDLLTQHVPAGDRRPRLAPATALGVLARNLLLARVPLYSQPAWAARAVAALLGLLPAEVARLTDDQVGRALDRLFDADRATLLTQVVVRAVSAFAVELAQMQNDSTTVTVTGESRQARGRTLRGQRALAIGHGHNKDHRPDLTQLLFVLSVSADGAVPIHSRACDGNTEDSTTHVQTWEVLRALAGRPNFLSAANSTLCAQDDFTGQYEDAGASATHKGEGAGLVEAMHAQTVQLQVVWGEGKVREVREALVRRPVHALSQRRRPCASPRSG